jgi:hypothetical protein
MTSKALTFILLTVVAFQISFAQQFEASQISSGLTNRALAVIRANNTVVNMQSADNVSVNTYKAVTVLHKSGEKYGQLALYYDKNTVIKSAKGEIYDEFGKLIAKFSLSNFRDESAVNDFSMFEDNRVKYYLPQVHSYPYTVVYQYEIRNKQNLIIPEWRPLPGFDIAVEKSSYEFICSLTEEVRVLERNFTGFKQENPSEKNFSRQWQVENLPAIKYEAYATNPETYFPSVKVAPKNFSYYNFKGSYTNWNELGKISYDYLLKDVHDLSATTINFIKNLVKDESSDKAKVKKIYEYLQQKTRYISVQIGIGGFKPIKASEVDRLGYGDCKALVNYMQSLLQEVGIESYYCVVDAGEDKTDLLPNFASMEQGNHIILCVPLKDEYVWLECTSQDAPFNYLGSFTDDRWVLACTKDGGKLLKTPKYEASKSTQNRKSEVLLANDGSVKGNLKTEFAGSQFDNHFFLTKKTPLERERQLKYLYDINNIEFTAIELEANTDLQRFTEKLTFEAGNYAKLVNDRISFAPNLFNVKRSVASVRNRTLAFEIKRGYTDEDQIVFALDQRILPLISPKIMQLESKFGKYYAEIKLIDGKLQYYRKLVLNDGIYSAQEYETYENFISQIVDYDGVRISLPIKE